MADLTAYSAYRFMVTTPGEEPREFWRQRGALRYLRRLMRVSGADYAVSVNDGETAIYPELEDAITRIKKFLRRRQVGVRASIAATHLGVTIARAKAWVVGIRPQAQTEGVEGIDRAVGYINMFWPHARFAGICVCKPSSDHRDCAAVDWFDTREHMEAAVRFFLQPEVREYCHVKYIILGSTIWAATAGFAPRHYGGDYHSHVHLSVYSGIPGAAC
jgi:hypothetical protein